MRLIGELKQKTGAEIAVVVVSSTAPLEAFDYAMKVAEAWKPGAAGKDNGVVFLVAVKDRKMFIQTGYGVEGPLPDGRVGEIRDRLVRPAFRNQDYAGGIRAATREMADLIARDAGVSLSGAARSTRPAPQVPKIPWQVWVLLLVIVLVFMVRAQQAVPGFGGRRSRRRGWDDVLGGGIGGGSFGGGFGGGGGGFGGFGGGSLGGGGAGGDW